MIELGFFLQNENKFPSIRTNLRIILEETLKALEDIHLLNMLKSALMIRCLEEGVISSSSMAQCYYIPEMSMVVESSPPPHHLRYDAQKNVFKLKLETCWSTGICR